MLLYYMNPFKKTVKRRQKKKIIKKKIIKKKVIKKKADKIRSQDKSGGGGGSSYSKQFKEKFVFNDVFDKDPKYSEKQYEEKLKNELLPKLKDWQDRKDKKVTFYRVKSNQYKQDLINVKDEYSISILAADDIIQRSNLKNDPEAQNYHLFADTVRQQRYTEPYQISFDYEPEYEEEDDVKNIIFPSKLNYPNQPNRPNYFNEDIEIEAKPFDELSDDEL